MTGAYLDLSIIISNYNTRELLRDCLESVYRWTNGISFEVICVDDHSPDGSADMVAEAFPDVIVIRNMDRCYYARNHNRATRLARGRYACHLDSDTLLVSNAMAGLVRFMDANPGAAVCGTTLLNTDGTVQHCIRSHPRALVLALQALNWHKLFPRSRVMDRYYHTDFDYSKAQRVDSIGTTAYIVRREVWESVGMFDERFGQFMVDLSYNYTLKNQGYEVWYAPCGDVIHHGSRSVTQDPEGVLRGETDAYIIFNEAYGYFPQDWFSRKLVRAALQARLSLRLLELWFRKDKTVVKGPVGVYAKHNAQPSRDGSRGGKSLAETVGD